VNLQEPFRRSQFGFETMDLALDVIVEADRSWRWKDEDELETFVDAAPSAASCCSACATKGSASRGRPS
jgi:hypothetical protein